MTPPIAILGAGPSGLALGRLLQVADIDYVIFERDLSATWALGRGGSGTLDLHAGSGQLALQEAGLFDQFKSYARYEATTTLADAQGKVYVRLGEDGESDRPEIDRKDLRALLLDSIPAEKVQWGLKVQQVRRDTNESMAVHFADGSIQSGFRLVVAADGAWSKARDLVTSAKPEYSGMHYLTTRITSGSERHKLAASLAGEGNYMSLSEGKQISAMKLGDGSYFVGVGLCLPQNWAAENDALLKDPSALREFLLQDHFDDWPELHTDLIKYSDGNFHSWPLYALPPDCLSWKTVPGITLIGDAAHLSTPFVGEGVNCAMYDSVQLAQQIIKYGLNDLTRAVSEYERLMFPRATDLIKRSATSGKLMFGPGTPRSWLEGFGITVQD